MILGGQNFRVKSCQERHSIWCRMGKLDDGGGDFTIIKEKDADCLPKILDIGPGQTSFKDEHSDQSFDDDSHQTSSLMAVHHTRNI